MRQSLRAQSCWRYRHDQTSETRQSVRHLVQEEVHPIRCEMGEGRMAEHQGWDVFISEK